MPPPRDPERGLSGQNGTNGTNGTNGVNGVNGHSNEHTPLLGSRVNTNDGFVKRHAKEGWNATMSVLTSNYVNVLLVFVPLGIISGLFKWSAITVFTLNFLAIVPLAALLSYATEEISLYVGQTLGGLLNATFGNAVELIVSIVALQKNEIRIVQASMLGSILSNILLVLGCCFLFGGMKYKEQTFNSTVASTMSSLMAVAAGSLIIPAALYNSFNNNIDPIKNPDQYASHNASILLLSRGASIVLLILYVLYLFFQLKTHTDLFSDEHDDEEEPETPALSVWGAALVLVLVTLMVAVCAEYLVDSIDSIVAETKISKTFIGLILLPIVGNAAEHVTAVVVATKNKMDLAIGVAIGSSLQIAILVTPFLVVLGWIMGREMSLFFQTFETCVFFVSVLITNYLIQDGKSNYLEGAMLLGIYVIIALSFYVYPDNEQAHGPGFPL
ncbi:hypothetical protein TWF696_007777 [Orbilia brochopaga]